MGCEQSTEVKYKHGSPTFSGDVSKCLSHNDGSLFRLIDPKCKKWAFYNDTTNTHFKISMKYAKESFIKSLGKTITRPFDEHYHEAIIYVAPSETQLFVQGFCDDFFMSYDIVLASDLPQNSNTECKSIDKNTITYLNGSPSFTGTAIVKCFKNDGNGLLFRIVDEKSQKWAFYNDTKEYNMYARMVCGNESDIRALGSTQLQRLSDGQLVAEVIIAPLTTEMFLEGDVNGFRLTYEANPVVDPLSKRNVGEVIAYRNGRPSFHGTETFQCFKGQDNGLLFRIFDKHTQRWAFYNDTQRYNMFVKMSFGQDSEVIPLGTTQLHTDTEGNTIAELLIPPLATEMFVQGVPNGFLLNYEAVPQRVSSSVKLMQREFREDVDYGNSPAVPSRA